MFVIKTHKEAMWYEKLSNNWVQCRLCFRNCTIPSGGRGVCQARENKKGTLYSLGYARPCAVHVDPIEKEPVLHFYPGTKILCIATPGCPFRCKFCQNWHISQVKPEDVRCEWVEPREIVELAKQYECIGISHTYTEPTVFYEYIFEISKIAKKEGIKNIIHTCGAMNPEPLKKLLPLLDAVTVDLKGFTQKFYETAIPNASLEHVLRNLKIIKELGVWLEIVTLVIPTYNDNEEDIKKMCNWILQNLGPNVPLHFSRFFPQHKFKNLPPTPIKTLECLQEIAKNVGLNYVTIGNVPGHSANSTFCPNCGKIIIKRFHFEVLFVKIVNGKCKFCNTVIPGVWE
jgi:pyruvate formate lyase activating enzyme